MILIIGGTGYIGSKVYDYLKQYDTVHTVDLEWFGNYVNESNLHFNYAELPASFFKAYDVVILFAGHSSVQMCKSEPANSFVNNIGYFTALLSKLSPETKFLYASSSSVYDQSMNATEDMDIAESTNVYDYSKIFCDRIGMASGKKYYALRLGTVNGYSPNLRSDLMINKMFLSSLETGVIKVYNSEAVRPILDITDLCYSIRTIVDLDMPPGVYNLCSFNETIGAMAEKVAVSTHSKVEDLGNTDTYSFSMSTRKFSTLTDMLFTASTESIVADLKKNGVENASERIVSGNQNLPLLW